MKQNKFMTNKNVNSILLTSQKGWFKWNILNSNYKVSNP